MTGVAVKVTFWPVQITLPELVIETDGVTALVVATDKVAGVEEPQLLLAVTEIVPPVPDAATVIESVVEMPVHPKGSDHV